MPLGNTSYLQIPLMAESDNQKYLLHNDAVQALDESLNRILTLDFLGTNITLTESQLTRYGSFRGANHTIPRTLTIPTTVGSSPAVTTNRFFIFHNDGGDTITITHGGAGTDVDVPASTVTLVLCDGSDIIAVASASGFDMGVREEGGANLVSNPTFLNFVGNGVLASLNGLGADITVTMPEVEDEGVSVQTDTTTFNFIGAGVTAAANGNGVDITIPGATSGVDVEDEGVSTVTAATVLDFIGANVSVADVGGDAHVTVSAPTAQDEGVGVQADPTFINFVGAGVTATVNGTGVDVTIPGATGTGIDVEEEGASTVTGATVMNFIGNNITAADVGGEAHVTAVAPTVQDEGVNAQTDPTFFNFIGAGVTATASGNGVNVTIPGASGTAIPVDDDGVSVVASADRLDFIGAGVSVAANGNTAEITISGGGSALETQDDGVQVVAATDTLNFTGAGVTVTNPSGDVTEINIPGGGGSGGQGTGSLFWEDMPVTNGDFETGDGTGWTTDVGAIRVENWSAMSNYNLAGMTAPVNGTYFYNGGESGFGGAQAAVESYQDFAVGTDTDSVFYEAYATLYKNFADNDAAFVELELRDISGNTLRTSRATQQGQVIGSEPAAAFLLSHPDQHTLRLRIGVTRNTGTNNNSGLDNVTLRRASVNDPAADTPTAEVIQTVDFSATPVASVDVADIDKYDEIQIMLRDASNGNSNVRMRLSTDGGATFDSTAGRYQYRYDGPGTANQSLDYFELGGFTVTDPQTIKMRLINPGQEVPTSYTSEQTRGSSYSFSGNYALTGVTDALQIYHSGGGNFTAGELYVVGVRYSKGTSYSSPVGFHAHRTTTQAAGVITFDVEDLDEGGDYNASNGVFTAPVGGLYHFYGAAVIDSGAGTGNAYIRVNGTQRARGHSFVSSGTQNDTHSVSLTVRLAPGDTVDFETSFALAASVTPWNYFGGFLLNAATSNTAINVIEETSTTLSSVIGHANGYVAANNAAAITYTVDDDTLVNHDIGTTISIEQVGAGQVTVSAGAGVTVRTAATPSTRTQYSVVMLTKVAADTWNLTGDQTP